MSIVKKLKEQLDVEKRKFIAEHPQSKLLFEKVQVNLFDGVPMPWMVEWLYPFPIFVKEAAGARIIDVDGIEYIDFCLGDTGAMSGHSPKASMDTIPEFFVTVLKQ